MSKFHLLYLQMLSLFLSLHSYSYHTNPSFPQKPRIVSTTGVISAETGAEQRHLEYGLVGHHKRSGFILNWMENNDVKQGVTQCRFYKICLNAL